MSKAVLIIDMPENCYECPLENSKRCPFLWEDVESLDKPKDCPLKPYKEAIPVEWLQSIMERQLIFAMNSEMEGTITVQDGIIHCVSGALACQVLTNVIKLWEKEKCMNGD